MGFHSRCEEEEEEENDKILLTDNFHADHHAYHNCNYGMSYAHEMLMNTTSPRLIKQQQSNNDKQQQSNNDNQNENANDDKSVIIPGGYRIKRFEENDNIILHFIPTKTLLKKHSMNKSSSFDES